ncbi:hypothetical protein EJ03DRAFT_329582 [Teratosphaeria nubilosa]|uniref:G-patch domain-containing protein n=1 Tax=Teratosphaeria nubilosa TaxID=161662 RepID=A0A6G1L277_9PEZI|nr:hypothetical protein EJ03DRAFT_329582 [Teratosphaeria nubilosa]
MPIHGRKCKGMDASSYLKRHGWRGDGHSLDHTGKGIKKPLLVSKKVDVLGVGLNKHTALSDQWWLKAFDSALKDIGTGKQSLLSNVQKHGVKNGDLYGRFVKGEGMAGTIGESVSSSGTASPVPEAAVAAAVGAGKRKRADDDHGESLKVAKLDNDGVDRKVKKLIKDAVRCGMIPPSSKEVEKGIVAGSGSLEKDSELSNIVTAAALPSYKPSDDVAKQKKARRDFKRAVRNHISGEPVSPQDRPTESQSGLSSKKLADYTRRAHGKGMSLETYIERRNEKNAPKASESAAGLLAFVIDTTGDPTFASRETTSVPATFSKQAIDGISAGELTVITNEAGDEIFRWHPDMPIPLDPRIWEDVEMKQLPKVIREARRAWRVGREARKVKRASGKGKKAAKKTHKK